MLGASSRSRIVWGVVCFCLGMFVSRIGHQQPAVISAVSGAPAAPAAPAASFTNEHRGKWVAARGTWPVNEARGDLTHARICDNDIREIYGIAGLTEAIVRRASFHATAISKLGAFMNKPRLSCQRACREFSCSTGPCNDAPAYSGMTYGWQRFDLLGPSAECPSIVTFGKGDEEKRFCFRRERIEQDPDCIAFSIGGNNKWGFEEDLVNRTKCHIHTFDCTVVGQVPPSVASRVTFHKLCLGSSAKSTKDREFADFKQLVARAGVDHVTLLKMDIEGFEYEAMQQIIDSVNNDQSLLPTQIALEFHYVTQFQGVFFNGRDLSPGEIYAFSNYLFTQGGYLVASRRDNVLCPHCTEVLLVKAAC